MVASSNTTKIATTKVDAARGHAEDKIAHKGLSDRTNATMEICAFVSSDRMFQSQKTIVCLKKSSRSSRVGMECIVDYPPHQPAQMSSRPIPSSFNTDARNGVLCTRAHALATRCEGQMVCRSDMQTLAIDTNGIASLRCAIVRHGGGQSLYFFRR